MTESKLNNKNIQAEPLISIVVPVYNAQNFLNDTINTVLSQTYTNWELLFIEDGSSDDSVKIIEKYINKDERIKLFDHGGLNKGAAPSRNKGIDEAKGRYIAFLDADDLWSSNKLEKQLKFMKKTGASFSYTGYEFADEKGTPTGNKVYVPDKINYNKLLRDALIWTSTVMVDMGKISKKMLKMSDLKTGEDYSTWLRVLREEEYAWGINQQLSLYRRTPKTLSSNKLKMMQSRWNVYRNLEGLGIVKSCWLMVSYAVSAIKRRIA